MKTIIPLFLFFILFTATAFAASIAVSPNSIALESNQESSFILLNPNEEPAEYTITASSDNIQISEPAGSLSPEEKKEIFFTTTEIEKSEYIIASFNSENTINPSISIKLTPINSIQVSTPTTQKSNTKQAITRTTQSSQNQVTTNAISNLQQTSNETLFDQSTLFLLGTIFVLILAIIFTKPSNKKHPTGHIGQNLRMFIKKFAH